MNHDEPGGETDLPHLRAPQSARRSDDAFVRAVVDDVRAARARSLLSRLSPAWFAAPALAGAAFLVFALSPAVLPPVAPVAAVISMETLHALADQDDATDIDVDVDGFDDATLLAFLGDPEAANAETDPNIPFAISTLDGSTQTELLHIEAALDRALQL